MKKNILFIILSLLWCMVSAQSDTAGMLRLTSGVHLTDGIYRNFSEWKANRPGIRNFQVVKSSSLNSMNDVELRYTCEETKEAGDYCIAVNSFGYAKDGVFYINQGFTGLFYRVFLMGSLTHFIAYAGYDDPRPYYAERMNGLGLSANDFREYLLDFNTGRIFEFTYKNFAAFLKEQDPELYQQLITSKKKREMIHHFMLKFNERHPVYVPGGGE